MIVFRLDTISALQYLLTEYLQLSSAQHMGRFYDNYLKYSEQMGRLGSLVVIFHQQHIGQTKQTKKQTKKERGGGGEEEEEEEGERVNSSLVWRTPVEVGCCYSASERRDSYLGFLPLMRSH